MHMIVHALLKLCVRVCVCVCVCVFWGVKNQREYGKRREKVER